MEIILKETYLEDFGPRDNIERWTMVTTLGGPPKVGSPEYDEDIIWFKEKLLRSKQEPTKKGLREYIDFLEDTLVIYRVPKHQSD